MLNSFWITKSLVFGPVSTKNNANNLPGLYIREHDLSSKHQRLLAAEVVVGRHIFFHLQNGTKHS
jgi:hypothetical protein